MYTNELKLPVGTQGVSQEGDSAEWHESAHIGDPFVLRFNGKYYLYPSSGRCPGVRCWESKDLVNWNYLGIVARSEALYSAYAPEVTYYNGTFYLIASPKGEGHYLFASKSPTGPYHIVRENFGKVIDGSIFPDNDGKLYFTHAEFPCIYGSEMDTQGNLKKDGPIEGTSMGHWTEGPGIFYREGRHYITMTGNHLLSRGYRIDYAVSKNGPLGPYRVPKKKTILVNTEPEHGSLGHSSNTIGPDLDSYWIVYHNFPIHADGKRDAYRSRNANVDRMLFNGEKLIVSGPTTYPTQKPQRPLFEGWADSADDAEKFHYTENSIAPLMPLPGGSFTAEFNLVPRQTASICFAGEQTYTLRFEKEHILLEQDGSMIAREQLIPGFDHEALVCVRLEKRADHVRILLGGMLRIDHAPVPGLGGTASIRDAGRVSYVAFSRFSGQRSDFCHYHAATQPVDAAMFMALEDGGCSGGHDEKDCGFRPEDGMRLIPASDGDFDLLMSAGEFVKYRINMNRSGLQRMFLRLRSPKGVHLQVIVGDQVYETKIEGKDLFMRTELCRAAFDEGLCEFTLRVLDGEAQFASIDLIPAIDAESETLESLALCHAVRQTQALLQHDKGFIDRLEGLQMDRPVQAVGILGEREHVDETVETEVIFRGDGDGKYAGIFLRLSEDSFFEDQVEYGLRGYFLGVNRRRAQILRMDFGAVELTGTTIPLMDLEKPYHLKAEVIGSTLRLWLEDQLILTFEDEEAQAYGRIAVGSFGARVTFPKVTYHAD